MYNRGRHIQESGCKTPLILTVGMVWSWMVIHTPRSISPWKADFGTVWAGNWRLFRNSVDALEKLRNLMPVPSFTPQNVQSVAQSLHYVILVPTQPDMSHIIQYLYRWHIKQKKLLFGRFTLCWRYTCHSSCRHHGTIDEKVKQCHDDNIILFPKLEDYDKC